MPGPVSTPLMALGLPRMGFALWEPLSQYSGRERPPGGEGAVGCAGCGPAQCTPPPAPGAWAFIPGATPFGGLMNLKVCL